MIKLIKSADFSPCGLYRYKLERVWSDKPLVMCIGLNPSTANSVDDDPTIRNLTAIFKNLNYGGLMMTNLFGLISSKPELLRSHPNPVGDENDDYLIESSHRAMHVVFCWGSFPMAEYRAKKVKKMFDTAFCFGVSKTGVPLHPMALWRRGIRNEQVTLARYQ